MYFAIISIAFVLHAQLAKGRTWTDEKFQDALMNYLQVEDNEGIIKLLQIACNEVSGLHSPCMLPLNNMLRAGPGQMI